MGFLQGLGATPEALLAIGTALSSMGRGEGATPGVVLARELITKRKAAATEQDTRGFLAAVQAGAKPEEAIGRFKNVDVDLVSRIYSHALQVREGLEAERRQKEWWVQQQGELQRLQEEDEKRKLGAQADLANETLAARGFLQRILSEGVPPAAVDGVPAQGPPAQVPLSQITPEMLPGAVTPRGFLAASEGLQDLQTKETLNTAREVRAEAAAAAAAREVEKMTQATQIQKDTNTYYQRLVAAGGDQSKVSTEGLGQIDLGFLKTLLAQGGADRRQVEGQEFTAGEKAKDRDLRREEGEKTRALQEKRLNRLNAGKALSVAQVVLGSSKYKDYMQARAAAAKDPAVRESFRAALQGELDIALLMTDEGRKQARLVELKTVRDRLGLGKK